MNHRTEAETFTLRAGEYAAACGQTMVSAFEDTLSGDLAACKCGDSEAHFPAFPPPLSTG